MYGVDVLEMTTTEFIARFAETDLPGEHYDNVCTFLKHADLVKFAKLVPELERTGDDFHLVHSLISDVRDEHLRRREAEIEMKKAKRTAVSDGEAA